MGLHRRRKSAARSGKHPESPDEVSDAPEEKGRAQGSPAPHTRAAGDRIRSLDRYSYEYAEEEASEVEARIRRMFYGSKVEND